MFWKDLDNAVPSLFWLSLRSVFGFLPFVKSPTPYELQMRNFIDWHLFGSDTPFDMVQLVSLAKIFNQYPEHHQQYEAWIKQLTVKQIQQVSIPVLTQLFASWELAVMPSYATQLLNRLELSQKQAYFQHTLMTAQTHLKQRFITSLSQTIKKAFQWCVRIFQKEVTSAVRLEVAKQIYSLDQEDMKPTADSLICSEEYSSLYPQPQFRHLWIAPVKKQTQAMLQAEGQTPLDFSTYLHLFSQDEQIDMLLYALESTQENNKQITILNRFFAAQTQDQQKSIMDKLLERPGNVDVVKAALSNLLGGNVNAVTASQLSWVASYYYANPQYAEFPADVLTTLPSLRNDLTAPCWNFSEEVLDFCLRRLASLYGEQAISVCRGDSRLRYDICRLLQRSYLNGHLQPSAETDVIIQKNYDKDVGGRTGSALARPHLLRLVEVYKAREGNEKLTQFVFQRDRDHEAMTTAAEERLASQTARLLDGLPVM